MVVFLVLAVLLGAVFLAIIPRLLFFLFQRFRHGSLTVQAIVFITLLAVTVVNWRWITSNELLAIAISAILLLLFVSLTYELYVILFFRSKKFRDIKASIAHHIDDCNQLNSHIEGLKSTFIETKFVDYGESNLQDTSNFHMKRRNWRQNKASAFIYKCSAVVCKNASDQPFKYICKYFNIKIDENSLSDFEQVQNNFSAAEQGKKLLNNQRNLIISNIRQSIPFMILEFSRERVIKQLGFHQIDFSDLYFPVYTFQYVSAGGNSSFRSDTKLDIQTLDRFIAYLGNLITFRKSIAGQRALMTSGLREKIKIRDNYTCQMCSLSTADEKNLLLEIDHIIPLAKGGITSEENLQTLCWRCNRTKGGKIIEVANYQAQNLAGE